MEHSDVLLSRSGSIGCADMACSFAIGGKQCHCRREAERVTGGCKMFKIRNANADGRNRVINGVTYTAEAIRAQRKLQMKAMDIQNITKMFDRELRCCQCHYVDSDIFFAAAGREELTFTALPKGDQTVQVSLDPITPSGAELADHSRCSRIHRRQPSAGDPEGVDGHWKGQTWESC